MDPTCGLADKFRDLVLNLTWEHLLYVIYCRKNIEQLNKRLKELTLERSSIQCRIDEARNNVEEIEDNVLCWLDEVDKIAEQVEQLRKENQAKTECSIISCPNLWLRYKQSKRAKAMIEVVVETLGKGKFNRVAHRGPYRESNKKSNDVIVSRVKIRIQITEALRIPSVKMVGLCGLGGIGKTTIAKDILKDEEIQTMFGKVIMATVSQEMNIGHIQDEIIDKLRMQLNERTVKGKASCLRERLQKEKNTLIILDDLWSELDLDEVGIPFLDENCGKNSEGCKILLTSRNEKLLSERMECQKVIKVGVLSEGEAWELFKSIAKLPIESGNPELNSIATEIVQKCGGLPLAIATAANTLKEKDIDGWKDYLARLKHPNCLTRSFTGIKEVDNILKLSYDCLSSIEYKHIFLLVAMMSHDSTIEDLLMYSVGFHILTHTDSMEDARCAISEIVSKLKSFNLFLGSLSSHHFTMHDVYRDVALSIASDELKAVIVRHRRLNKWLDENEMEGRRGICLQESDIGDFSEELHGPELEFFLLNSIKFDWTMSKDFFKSSKKLKLLAFTNVHFQLMPLLGYLKRLQVLCLHSCSQEDITEVGSLRELKVSSLANSDIERLPDQLAGLTSLQILNLSNCSSLKIIPHKLLSSFKKLEILYMENSFDQWKVEESSRGDKNASLDELKDLPISCLEIEIPNISMLPEHLFLKMKLKRYRIFIGKHWKGQHWKWWRGNYKTTKMLKLELESNIHFSAGLRKLLEGVEDLHLHGSHGLENVLHIHDGIGFPCLKRLEIESKSYNLRALTVDFDIKDRGINNASDRIFKSLFNNQVLKSLKNLEEIKVNDCNMLEKVFDYEDLNEYKEMESSSVVVPLKILELRRLSKLKNVWSNNHQGNVSFPSLKRVDVSGNLKKLVVESCGLVKLVPFHVLKSLKNLEELEVSDCNMLEKVFDYEDLNEYKETESSSVVVPLKILELRRLPKLKNVWSNHHQGNVSFPGLRRVDVSGNLKKLVVKSCGLVKLVPFHVLKSLENLEELEVSDCNMLEKVFDYEDLNEYKETESSSVVVPLKILELRRLSKLKNVWSNNHQGNVSFPGLRRVDVSGNLKKLVVESGGLVKLVPFHVLKSLKNLEELKVSDCNMLEKVFDYEDFNEYKETESSSVVVPLKILELRRLPKLKNVWSNHHQGNVSFPSLRIVDVFYCKSLTSIFPAYIAKGMLGDLEKLKISNCGIDVIVAKGVVLEYANVAFEFPRLTSLHLYNLPNLRNFYPLSHTLEWSHLNQLSVGFCDELEIFEKEVSSSLEIHEEGNTQDSKYPLLSHDKVIRNLEMLTLQGEQVKIIGSGQFLMRYFPKLNLLHLSLQEGPCFPYRASFPNLRELQLSGNGFEDALTGDNYAALAARFPKLTLQNISKMRRLSPSLVSSPNLTHLHVASCDGLTTLMTSSIAKSLAHLTRLSVSSCSEMEEIIAKEEGEDDESKEIIFFKLQFLGLEGLPKLKRFCAHNFTFKFPLLDELVIRQCLKFNIFSPGLIETPSLQSVQLWQDGKNHCVILDHNLNKAIYHQRFKESREVVLNKDDAIIIRDDQFPVDHYPQVEILRIEGFFEEWVTFPYTLLQRFPKLNQLHVKNSSFEEIVPSQIDIVDQILAFKNIFPSHAPSSTSFDNLAVLKVSKCHQLVHLVTTSNAKSLVNLETLEIEDCEKMEEIVGNETNEDAEDQVPESPAVAFEFLRLIALHLSNLPKLRNFYPHRYTLEWPHLKELSIKHCDELEIFEKEISCPSAIHKEDNKQESKYPLLSHDKVLSNFEKLTLQGEQVKIIESSQFKTRCFPKLNLLHLCLLEGPFFSYWRKSSPNLRELKLSGNGFEDALTGDNYAALAACFPKLTLENISKMRRLSPSLVSSPNLTHLCVAFCNRLSTLMTSSTAHQSLVNLTYLSVSSCNKMEEIITKAEGEDDENKEIIFFKLQFLELESLKSLKRFCAQNYTFKFPLLDQLIIKECPNFKKFSPGPIKTPSLQSVQLWQDWQKHREIWDTDLHTTFYHERFVASREVVLDEGDASMIRNDQFPADCCPQVEVLGIEGFVEEWVIFPYTLLKRFPKLNEFHVNKSSFEEIFPLHTDNVPFKKLRLSNLDQLKNIFPLHEPSSTSFHNLTVIKVFKCHQLLYLVTYSIAKSLLNLESLEIEDCEKMEEIVRNEANDEDVEGGIALNELRKLKLNRLPRLKMKDNEKDVNIQERPTNTICTNIFILLSSHNKVLLPKLETLEISNLLNNLISLIWNDQLVHSSFSNLKTLIVKNCKFIKLVPLHVLKSLSNLEKLEINSCQNMEIVFGFEDLNDYHKHMKLSSLNLTHLEVKLCAGLTTLMTSSVAQSLANVTNLSICDCNQIEEIIMKQEGKDDEGNEIFFNEMKFLELDGLPRLKRFCGYNYTFMFPSLEHVTITECPQFTMFCLGVIDTPRLQSIQVNKYRRHEDIWMTNLNNTIQHLFTFEKVISTTRSMALNEKNITMVVDVFPEVRNLYVESFMDDGVTFPYSSLERFPKLNWLSVEHCSFEEIFPSHDEIVDFMGKIPPFKGLYIANLDKLKSIWKNDSQLPPIYQDLTRLEVKSCSLVKLAPSSASFKHLCRLSVTKCHKLIHLVTTSTAKSFVRLRVWEINDCKKMEQIVMNETNEDVEAEITFNELQKIKLTGMPCLKAFSSQTQTFELPELKKIKIYGCPEMKKFCIGELKTPELSKVKIEDNDMEWKDGEDLNKTIEMLA